MKRLTVHLVWASFAIVPGQYRVSHVASEEVIPVVSLA
jgi:hypothetical protein